MRVLVSLANAVKAMANIHRAGPVPDILLFATPRSGSTWLMEIIASQPGVKFYDEPLNLRRENVAASGIVRNWSDLMPDTCDAARIIGFLRDLQLGRHGYMNPPPFRPHHRFFTNRIVFKIHEIEHLMEDVERELSALVVYLLRHPIATSISRRALPRLDLFLNCRFHFSLFQERARRSAVSALVANGSFLQRALVSWCFENLVALRAEPQRWLFVTYEELLLNPSRSVELLADRLRLPNREALSSAFDRPATNLRMSDRLTLAAFDQLDSAFRRYRLATKWRDGATAELLRQAAEILDLFQIDAYHADEDLATSRLLHFDDTASRLDEASAAWIAAISSQSSNSVGAGR